MHLRNFSVINTVGAVSLGATLNCEEFAYAHTATAFYDAQSFVGLAWRPTAEPICCGARSACGWVGAHGLRLLPCGPQKSTAPAEQSAPPPPSAKASAPPSARLPGADLPGRSLPGSKVERQLQDAFSRMLPELCAPLPPPAAPTLARPGRPHGGEASLFGVRSALLLRFEASVSHSR